MLCATFIGGASNLYYIEIAEAGDATSSGSEADSYSTASTTGDGDMLRTVIDANDYSTSKSKGVMR